MTETKGKEWREFWATQDPDDTDGVYIMSEDQSYVEDHEKVETKFKVIEYAAYEALQKELEKYKKGHLVFNQALHESEVREEKLRAKINELRAEVSEEKEWTKQLEAARDQHFNQAMENGQRANMFRQTLEKVCEAMKREKLADLVYDWKHYWMNQTQNSQADYENYHRRAFGVDANMVHSLADRISKIDVIVEAQELLKDKPHAAEKGEE